MSRARAVTNISTQFIRSMSYHNHHLQLAGRHSPCASSQSRRRFRSIPRRRSDLPLAALFGLWIDTIDRTKHRGGGGEAVKAWMEPIP